MRATNVVHVPPLLLLLGMMAMLLLQPSVLPEQVEGWCDSRAEACGCWSGLAAA